MSRFYVYEHWRTDTDTCFYVGKGSRYRANYVQRPHNRHHSFILKKLEREGHTVDVKIVAGGLEEVAAFALEIERIAHWRGLGVFLANQTDGGDGPSGMKHSDETREKIRIAHTGRKRSPETCARIGAANKGKNLGKTASPETRDKMSVARKGKLLSEEHKAALSAGRMGVSYGPLSEEHKAKIGAKSKGRIDSPETRERKRLNALSRPPQSDDVKARIAEKVAALWADPEYRQRMSDAHKGFSPTEEHRANLRAGQAKRAPRTEEHKARISAALKISYAERREARLANSST